MAPSFQLALAALHQRSAGPSSTANITCARPLIAPAGKPVFGNTTLHELMIYICAPCLVITTVSCFFLTWRHLHRWTAPLEQRQILRIANLPIAYCLFNFLAICFLKDAYLYIEPWAGLFEAFAVAALFMLTLEYVAPDGTDREKFFDQLPGRDKKGNPQAGGSWMWYIITYGTVMQYPLSKFIFLLIQVITQYYGVYCENSFSPKYAHLYLFVADIVLIGGALGACIRFYRRFAKDIDKSHRGRGKVISFVGIVAFQIIQGIIFHLLNGKLFSPSDTLTYNDINFGIPSLLTCTESVIFSLIFHWSFSSSEFTEGVKQDRYGLGAAKRQSTIRAIVDAMNPVDILLGIVQAFTYIFVRYRARLTGKHLQRQATLKVDPSSVHLEPLTRRDGSGRDRGYSETSYDQNSPPLDGDSAYDGPEPPMAAQDPAMGGRAQTFKADYLRPSAGVRGDGGYAKISRSRSPSPEQFPRQMV